MVLATARYRWGMKQDRNISLSLRNLSLMEVWKNVIPAEDTTWIAGCSQLMKLGDWNFFRRTLPLNITHYTLEMTNA